MSVMIKGVEYDTMGEACTRLDISRSSMLRYLKEEFFSPPLEVKQGKGKPVRYFTEDWYRENEARLHASRNRNSDTSTQQPSSDPEN